MKSYYVIYLRTNSTVNSVEQFSDRDNTCRIAPDQLKGVITTMAEEFHNNGYYIAWQDYNTGCFTASKFTHEIEVVSMPYGG